MNNLDKMSVIFSSPLAFLTKHTTPTPFILVKFEQVCLVPLLHLKTEEDGSPFENPSQLDWCINVYLNCGFYQNILSYSYICKKKIGLYIVYTI